jgi:hypothetical protein
MSGKREMSIREIKALGIVTVDELLHSDMMIARHKAKEEQEKADRLEKQYREYCKANGLKVQK